MRKILLFTAITALVFSFQYSVRAQLTETVVALTGSVFNEISREPIRIPIKAYDENGNVVYRGKSNEARNGYYYITGLRPGQKYTVQFSDSGYFKEDFEIKIPLSDKYAEFSRDFLIKPKAQGVKIKQKVSPFELRKSKLRAGANFFLEDILNTLKANPTIKFQIVAYPDGNEGAKENKELTEGRCDALKDFFVIMGIDDTRITTMPMTTIDPDNPLPTESRAKGKRYIGPIYFVVEDF